MISKGLITQRANDERLPAHPVERDYILAQLVAEIGAAGNERLVFKGGTLLRLCYFADYRYSADLDFSATNGLTAAEALSIVGTAIAACRARLELPVLELAEQNGAPPWITYVGPLGAKPRKLKLDISDDELVTCVVCRRLRRWLGAGSRSRQYVAGMTSYRFGYLRRSRSFDVSWVAKPASRCVLLRLGKGIGGCLLHRFR